MNTNSVYKSVQGKEAILAAYDLLLEKWPVPFEKININTNHGDTFIIASGEKALPPLVLLHGSGSNSAMWIGDICEYTKYFRVYSVDLPGEPGKSTEIRPDLKTCAYSDWMKEVLIALAVKKASFVGISLGGWLAIKFAVAHQENIEKLVLLCPSGIGPQKASVLLYLLPMKLFGKWGEEKGIKAIMGIKKLAKETIEYSRLISNNFLPYVGVVPIFTNEELRSILCPTLLIAGDKDVLIDSQKSVERARRTFQNITIDLLPGVGHGLINQREKIISFLTERDITQEK